jgi:hypothetical protein
MDTFIDSKDLLPLSRATFCYLQNDPIYEREKPYYCSMSLEPHLESSRTNLKYEATDTDVRDLRGFEHLLNVEEHGFEYVTITTCDLYVGIETFPVLAYIDQVTRAMKSKFKAEVCFSYSYRVRMVVV